MTEEKCTCGVSNLPECKDCDSTAEVSESSLNDGLPDGVTLWKISSCHKCGSCRGYIKEDERGDGEFVCLSCGFSWWVDGPDS